MGYKEMSRQEKRKLRQRIILGALVFVLAVGLVGSSLAFPLIDLFGGGAEQPATNLTMTAADLEKDVKENPQDDTLYVALAKAYLEENNKEKAIEAYEKSLALKPDQSNVRMDLAYTYFLLGQNDQAIEQLQYEIEHTPTNHDAHYVLAQVLAYGKKDYESAIEQLNLYLQQVKTGTKVDTAKQLLEEWQKILQQ